MKEKPKRMETISFVLRNNKTYQITFDQGVLIIDKKIIWQAEEAEIFPRASYQLKFVGTGPQNFRQKAKMRLRKGKKI